MQSIAVHYTRESTGPIQGELTGNGAYPGRTNRGARESAGIPHNPREALHADLRASHRPAPPYPQTPCESARRALTGFSDHNHWIPLRGRSTAGARANHAQEPPRPRFEERPRAPSRGPADGQREGPGRAPHAAHRNNPTAGTQTPRKKRRNQTPDFLSCDKVPRVPSGAVHGGLIPLKSSK